MESSRSCPATYHPVATTPSRLKQRWKCIIGDRMVTKGVLTNVTLLAALSAMPLDRVLAESVECPPSISVRESLDSAQSDGWSIHLDDGIRHLDGVTFFDGAPEDNKSIAPSRDASLSGRERIAEWRFGSSGVAVWLACPYRDTGISLSRQLPPYAVCRMTYAPGGVIRAINCD